MKNKIRKFFTNLVGMGLISFLVFPSIPAIQQFNNPSTIKDSKNFSDSLVANYSIPKTKNSKDAIIARIYYWANFYGTDFNEIYKTIEGESNFKMVYGDSGKAYGYAQFHKGTFYNFSEEMGFKEADYYNGEHQIKIMSWAFSQGEDYKRHWTIYRTLTKK